MLVCFHYFDDFPTIFQPANIRLLVLRVEIVECNLIKGNVWYMLSLLNNLKFVFVGDVHYAYYKKLNIWNT